MHIADFGDVADVAQLVNSTGGDWGYITLVSTDHDRDAGRWQKMFDQMRRLHLIPLVRIATHVEKDYWVKPNPVDFDTIVSFFNSLNWPIQNRYVILYNEPNHAKEWGNQIDPEGYAHTLSELGRKFKAASEDFFVLPAGLDVSAASDALSLDAALYLDRMIGTRPDILDVIDGWTSHSYPNPGFSGSVYAVGRGTLRSYMWELSYLQKLGLTKTLPVFITETGWSRSGGLSSEAIGRNLQIAAGSAWADQRIAAITPFVFNYQTSPFDTFSWKKFVREGGYYAQYDAYKTIVKVAGKPKQNEAYTLVDQLLPPTLVSGSTYTLSAQIINDGQGILSSTDEYELALEQANAGFILIADILPTIEPSEKGEVTIHLKAPDQPGTYAMTLGIRRNDQFFPLQTQDITIVPPPSLTIDAQLGWRTSSDANDVAVLVFENNKVLHKFTGLSLKKGQVTVAGLTGIIPGYSYRTVITVPDYLPRQSIVGLNSSHTTVRMKRLLPLDFNRDGKLDSRDFVSAFSRQPKDIIKLFVSP